MHTPVKVNSDSYFGADRCTNFRNTGNSSVDFPVGVNELKFIGGIHLDGGKPTLDHVFSRLAHVARMIAADPGINPDRVPACTAQ